MINLINGDCLEQLTKLENNSVDLVLIDPPYNIGKDEWDKWKTVELYVDFLRKVFLELQRVLKDNGSFYFFHNDFMQIVEIQNMINKDTDLILKSFIIWNKPNFRAISWKNPSDKNNLRSWFNINEYCLFYTFQDETGRKKVDYDLNNYKSLREYSKSIQDYINLNLKSITNIIGRKVEHFFYHSSSQFSLPTESTYKELTEYFNLKEFSGYKEYEELRKEYEELRKEYEELRKEYEEQRYTFNLEPNHNNLWISNDKKNSGKEHSCRKPNDILEKIIKCSSNENDTVLDCFMGSGSTGVAAKNLNRNFIGIEVDKDYFEIAKRRINNDK